MLLAQLTSVDLAIVAIYILAATFLGVWFNRHQRDLSTYLVGDRDVGWWLVLVSIVATETSTVTFLSIPGLGFNREGGNLAFLQLAFGFVAGRILIAWFLLPQYLHGHFFSAYQLLKLRFSTAVQRTASSIFLLTRTVADGLRLYLAALLLEQCTGWDTASAALAIGGATMLYTYLGGMKAVIWTDLIQFVIYITGALFAAYFILGQVDGGLDGFMAVGQAHHKFDLIFLSTNFDERYTLWAGLIGGAFLTMASHGADQMMVQRYLCSRSLAGARTALVASGFVVLLQFLLFLLIGVGMFILWEQHTLTLPVGIKDDAVFGHFIVHFLPTGVVGLLIAAVLAASMASLASSLSSAASAFVSDFYRPMRPGRDEKHYLRVSRLMTCFWGLTRIGVALAAVSLVGNTSVVGQVLSVAGFTTGTILGLFLLGTAKRPVPSASALGGLVVGFLAVLCVWWLSDLAWPWYAPLGTVATVSVALFLDSLGIGHGSFADRSTQPSIDQSGPADAAATRQVDER
ncbi:MAG TPA: sodium/solute symporter [Gemmataceae bacterium]|nr:sodium/solute symporter [Gemmataceae bacterium]